MTFPTIQSSTTGAGDSASSTAHTLNLPAGITSGDLLLFIAGTNSAGTPPGTATIPGWTTTIVGSTNPGIVWGYRVANGSEGSTATLTTDTAQTLAFTCYRITGWQSAPQDTGTAGAANTNNLPDPPLLTPTWGTADTLWIALYAQQSASAPVSAPANYTGLISNIGSPTNSVAVAVATRQLNASSEDPGTFTAGAATRWRATSIAVRPQTLGNATFAGSGALSASARLALAALGVFGGSGTLSASSTRGLAALAALNGAGLLSARASIALISRANFNGAGSLSVTATFGLAARASFIGSGGLTVSTTTGVGVFAGFDGRGSLTVGVLGSLAAEALFPGSGNLCVQAYVRLGPPGAMPNVVVQGPGVTRNRVAWGGG